MSKTFRRIVAAGVAVLFASGCADQTPGAPQMRPALEVVNPPVIALTLKRTYPLAQDITRSITLFQQGGVIDIPEAGFHLNIPRKAIGNDPVTITVTAIAGDNVAYEFYPKGMVFKSAINMTQALDSTTWYGNEGNTKLEGGYFRTRDDLEQGDSVAVIYEFIPVTVTASGNRVHMPIKHFSGYVLASGRVSTTY